MTGPALASVQLDGTVCDPSSKLPPADLGAGLSTMQPAVSQLDLSSLRAKKDRRNDGSSSPSKWKGLQARQTVASLMHKGMGDASEFLSIVSEAVGSPPLIVPSHV